MATYHFDTENHSFTAMHFLLKDRGVKNNKFFLYLRHEELARPGLSPLDPNLPDEIKALMVLECVENPWYFFREVVRIPVSAGLSRFMLHLGNLALLWLMMRNANTIVLLPRQNFKTMSAVTFFLYAYELATSNSAFIFSNKEQEDSNKNLKHLKEVRARFPVWLGRPDSRDVDNVKTIESKLSGNSIKASASAQDPEAADKLGRGMTVPLMWFDEFAFLKYNEIIYGAASPAQQQAAQDAEKNGAPHFKLITTTPNNADVPAGGYCLGMINEAAEFGEWWYDEEPDFLAEHLERNSSNDFAYLKYDWRDLGRDKKWYTRQCRGLNWDSLRIKREINLEWTMSTDKSVFDEDVLEEVKNHLASAQKVRFGEWEFKIIGGYALGAPLVMSVDVAGGLDRDSSAVTVFEADTSRMVAWFKSAHIEIDDLRRFLEEFHKCFFPHSAVVVERSPISLDMISRLMKGPLKKWLVYEVPDDQTTEKPKSAVNHVGRKRNLGGNPDNRRYGVAVSSANRPEMMDILRHDLINHPEVFRADDLLDEIAGLQRNKAGRIDHAPGKHDDLLMAYLVGRWALGAVESCARILSRIEGVAKTTSAWSRFADIAAIGGEGREPPRDPFAPMDRAAAVRSIWELNQPRTPA